MTSEIERIYYKEKRIADSVIEDYASFYERPSFQKSIELKWDESGPRQVVLWDLFEPIYNCPTKERIGNPLSLGDEGKWICGLNTLLQRKDCIVYSFGSNAQTTFEETLLNSTPCEVHTFDPTLSDAEIEQMSKIRGLHFHKYGVGATNEIVHPVEGSTMGRKVEAMEVKTLGTIMQELGHAWVDLVKMDIDGPEWGVLQECMTTHRILPFTQLQVELHTGTSNAMNTPSLVMLATMRNLTDRLRVFSAEPNIYWPHKYRDMVEYAFIQVENGGVVRPSSGDLEEV